MHALPKAHGSMHSQFPGELALRDLPADAPHRMASLMVARLLVLQLAERLADGSTEGVSPIEVAAVRSYIEPIRERFPADALRLERVLDRIAAGTDRRTIAALLAAADTTLLQAHGMAAYGFFHAAYALGTLNDADAAALSAASRLRELSAALGRQHLAERWDRRARHLLERCR